MTVSADPACSRCGATLGQGWLACPRCGRLVFADHLETLAAQARAVETTDPTAALGLWREALTLLPRDSRQYAMIVGRIDDLGKTVSSRPSNGGSKLAAGATAVGLTLFKFKAILVGLAKLPTLLSMLAYFGIYWRLYGWQFALGLVLSIYVHEMGHVIALRRLGFKATSPMFIPGLGALIRLQQEVTNPREDAEIGLAGPIYGLGAAIVCAVAYVATGLPILAAIAGVGAWVNLFNLMPIWTLDGGRGFHALSRVQRSVAVLAVAAAWAATSLFDYRLRGDYLGDGMLILIAIAGVYRIATDRTQYAGSRRALFTYTALILALTAVAFLRHVARIPR